MVYKQIHDKEEIQEKKVVEISPEKLDDDLRRLEISMLSVLILKHPKEAQKKIIALKLENI